MAGVDATVAQGFVDATHMYVSGCSGGGVLSSWVIGHTDRFAAAAVRCPVIDWLSMTGNTDIPLFTYSFFQKPFWEDPSDWLSHSSVMTVGKVTTPTLLMTGVLDRRTPMPQGLLPSPYTNSKGRAEEAYAKKRARDMAHSDHARQSLKRSKNEILVANGPILGGRYNMAIFSRKNGGKSIPIWRKEDRADHIYRVAAEVMCRKGYEATSMNDIADAVGLTKAGIYHYIRGKEQLLFEIMNFAMDMVDEDVVAPAREIADAEERLHTIIDRHTKRILEVGGAVTILLEEMPALTPAHQRTVRNRKRAYFELVRQTLEQLAAEGKLRDVNPTVAAFSLFGMILWICRWYRRDGDLTPAAVHRDFHELALNAVLRSDARCAEKSIASIVRT